MVLFQFTICGEKSELKIEYNKRSLFINDLLIENRNTLKHINLFWNGIEKIFGIHNVYKYMHYKAKMIFEELVLKIMKNNKSLRTQDIIIIVTEPSCITNIYRYNGPENIFNSINVITEKEIRIFCDLLLKRPKMIKIL